jgi:hypothetical protein
MLVKTAFGANNEITELTTALSATEQEFHT